MKEFSDLTNVYSLAASVTSEYTVSFSMNQVKKEIVVVCIFVRNHSWLICRPLCLNSLCIACSVRQISFELEIPLLVVLSEFGILTLDYWSWHYWPSNSIGNWPGNYPLGSIYHSLMPTSSPGTQGSTMPLSPPSVQDRSSRQRTHEANKKR